MGYTRREACEQHGVSQGIYQERWFGFSTSVRR